MINMNVKKTLVLSLLTVSLTSNATEPANKDTLAKQCRTLAENIITLVSSQGKKSCMEKLGTASMQIKTAGEFIIEDKVTDAKDGLDKAISALQYAELNNCNRYIQISHSKFEAQKIKNRL